MSFIARHLSYRIGQRPLLRDFTLNLGPGQVHALIGPNGSGKSTALKLLSGELRSDEGEIELNGKPLYEWTPQEQALQRAVLPQNDHLDFSFTAQQVVELGRMPARRGNLAHEKTLVQHSLRTTDALHLADHLYPTLSGGERSRVQMARVLVQVCEPISLGARYLLLDEPTANLDLLHQHQCLRIAKNFASENAGVLLILHDLNLAMTYADQVTLLCEGTVAATGTPTEVLNSDQLERVYGIRIERLQSPDTGRTHLVVNPS